MRHDRILSRLAASAILAAVSCLPAAPSCAQGVLDEWATVKAPPPPTLSRVTLDPKTTALLVLDLAKQTCNAKQRPRCIAMLPRVQKLLATARAKNWTVIYTLGTASTTADILAPVAMLGNETLIKGYPDKFLGTDLETVLTARGIKTVVAIGAAAEGAVLHTAATAAFLGFDVVVPIDGMAAESPYPEQYTAWDLLNAPRLGEHIKLSAIDLIQ